MTLPLVPTLGEIRNSVMIRCGLETSGNLGGRQKALLDQHIVAQQHLLYRRAGWCRLVQTLDVTLTTSVVDYDIPQGTTPGMIHRIAVRNTDNKWFPLTYDDAVELENYDTTATSMPRWWQILNDQLHLAPYPDATQWPELRIWYSSRPADLVNDSDRPVVDAEALIRATTILHKEYLGIGGDQTLARKELEQYLRDLRSDSSPGRSIRLASLDPDGPAYWDLSTPTGQQPYDPSWNPW